MKKSIKERGRTLVRGISRLSKKAEREGKEHLKSNLIARLSHASNVKLLILEWSLLVSALILLAITQAFWFSDSYSGNVFTSGGNYTEATLGDVNSMNPLFATTSSEKVLSRLLFATLSTVDQAGKLAPGLAETILPSDNGKVWKVKLREKLYWADGEPITNEDVIFTANLIKNPAVSSVYSTNLANVKISENEDGEIVFELPSAYADFMSALEIPIVPKHLLENVDPRVLIENSFSNIPVGSGAFTFNAVQSNTAGDEKTFYLSANPNYYQSKAMLNGFAVHTYKTREDIIKALNNNTVTATAELFASDSEKITSGQYYRKDSGINSGAFIFFNTASDVMKNKELRNAIRQGLNLEEIRNAAPGTAALDYPLLNSQLTSINYPDLPDYDYDAAKNKIAELAGDISPINIATVNSGFLPGVASVITEQLTNLGLAATLTNYDEGPDFINNIVSRRNYDILIYEVELGSDPDLLPYYHSSQAAKANTNQAGLNLSNYHNAIADDLLLGARDTIDEQLRIKKYETFLEYWVADAPAVGLYQTNLTYYYNKNVRTFSNNLKLVTPLDRFSDVNIWAVNKSNKNKTP